MRSLLFLLISAASASPTPTNYTTFEVDGRSVDAFVPQCVHANSPIILALHAWATSQKMEEKVDRLAQYAGSECAVIVYPQGNVRGSLMGMVGWSWNAGGCCPNANINEIDDVTFLDHVITGVSTKFQVSDELVFVVGLSNGGMMANRFSCSNKKVKAFVAVSGPLINGTGEKGSEAFTCARSLPYLHFHGTADGVVPYDGCKAEDKGFEACKELAKSPGFPPLPWPTVPEVMADWRARNGIQSNVSGRITFKNASTSCESWGSSANNVTLCSVGGEGHAWPGICSGMASRMPGMHCSHDIDASEHVMEFFRKYMPAAPTVVV